MSIEDQESIAGPFQRTEAQAEVQRLLTHLEGWVNFPRVMLDVGVTQRSLIPLERLQYEASQLETIRLQHLAGRANSHAYPPSTRHTIQDQDEPNHLEEVMRYVGVNRSENPPLRLDQIAVNPAVQKNIQATIDRLQTKIDKSWTPAQTADDNLNIIWDELELQHWATEEKAKVFVLWVLLSKQLKEALRFQGWVQHYTRGVALGDPTVQTYDVLVGWVRKLKGIPTVQQRAESAIHRQEVEM